MALFDPENFPVHFGLQKALLIFNRNHIWAVTRL